MTEKEYRQHPAISRSELWHIRESPQKFQYYRENPQAPTPALLFGQLFHKMALEPTDVWSEFAVAPSVDKRTKDGKERWKHFAEVSEGKSVVTMDMVEQASSMCVAINQEPLAVKLLAGEHEKPFFWVDELTGEECKCRVDCLNTSYSQPIIIDVKSTTDASTDGFMRSAVNYGYTLQSGMYLEGVCQNLYKKSILNVLGAGKAPLFVFIVVEKEPPYSINILQSDDLFVKYGYDIFRELIGLYKDCKESNNFFGYLGKYDVINNLSLPSYLAKEIE